MGAGSGYTLARPTRISASAVLAVDTQIVSGVPVVGLLLIPALVLSSGVVSIIASIHGQATGAVNWTFLTWQLTVDGLAVIGGATAGYPVWVQNSQQNSSLVFRASGLAPGAHSFGVNAQCQGIDRFNILPIGQPTYHSASLVVTELDG